MKKISDFPDINIYSGQIMSRVTAGDKLNDEAKEFRVVVPKAITEFGTINITDMPIEKLKVIPESNRITELGDIVIKLSTPYDCAIVNEDSVGCVVPSFCAIIRNKSEIDTTYLQAFFNSKLCKDQLRSKVVGTVMTILTVGKIKDVEIPIPNKEIMREIGMNYISVQKKITILKRIVELETKRNDVVFYNLEKQ